MRQEAQRAEALAQATARQEAAQREAQRQENLRQEAQRAQALAQATVQREAQRQDAERAQAAAAQAAAAQAAAQREAQQRQAAAAQAAAAQAAAAQAEAAQAAAAQAAAVQAAAAQAAAAQAAAAQAAAAQAAAAQAAAARQAAAERDAQRLETQRQEAQRKAEAVAVAKAAEKPIQPPMESARRRALIGRTEQDLRLRMVAEGWRQKIEQNAPFDVFQAAKNGAPYENPVVTVSLRRDGSLESVVIDRSSGVVAIDNAVRRIVLMLSPYAAFTSDVAMEYDVIEIRRIWTFDTALRLLYGGR